MCLEQQRGKRLDGRRERQEQDGQAAKEGGGLVRTPAGRVTAAQQQPAAQVDGGGEREADEEPGVEWPGAQEGVGDGTHGSHPRPGVRGGPGFRPAFGPQASEELGQGGHLGGVDLLAVGRHVAAAGRAVAHLVDKLVARQRWPTVDRSGPRRPPVPSKM